MAGRRPVEEAFVARRPAIRLLVVPQRRQALERLVLHATSLRIPIIEVEGGTLTALAGFDGHQGIALVVGPRRFASLDEILARSIERAEPPFVLALDSLEDPQNVGTLLRSAEAAGVHGVIFPTHRQAPLSPSAVKASAGAVEHLLLSPVDDLPGALSDLRTRGLRVVGAEAGAPLTARQADLRGPLAIVVGSEGQGLSPAVRRRCDFVVRIPMRGAIGSLNAAVAGSIMLFEAVAQRDPDGTAGEAANARPARGSTTVGDEVASEETPTDETPTDGGTPDEAAPDARRRRRTRHGVRGRGDRRPPAGRAGTRMTSGGELVLVRLKRFLRPVRPVLAPFWRRLRPFVEPTSWQSTDRTRIADRASPIRPMAKAEFEAIAKRYPYYLARGRYMSVAAGLAGDLIEAHGLQSALELGPHLRPVIVGADVMDLRAQPDLQIPQPRAWSFTTRPRRPGRSPTGSTTCSSPSRCSSTWERPRTQHSRRSAGWRGMP